MSGPLGVSAIGSSTSERYRPILAPTTPQPTGECGRPGVTYVRRNSSQVITFKNSFRHVQFFLRKLPDGGNQQQLSILIGESRSTGLPSVEDKILSSDVNPASSGRKATDVLTQEERETLLAWSTSRHMRPSHSRRARVRSYWQPRMCRRGRPPRLLFLLLRGCFARLLSGTESTRSRRGNRARGTSSESPGSLCMRS